MSIQLGTVAAIGFADFTPRTWLECYRRLGCTVVQAYRNQGAQISIQQMRAALAEGGMPCDSLHGVFGEQYDPSCPEENARRYAVDSYKSEGDLVQLLGGSLVVVHCSTIRRDGISAEERAMRLGQLKKSIAELGTFGQSIGVRYAFENLPAYHPIGSDVDELVRILEEVDAPNTGLCFDTGHAHMIGNVADAVRQTRGRMIYLHYSDNSGAGDEHEMPTYGTIDSAALARAVHDVNYSGTMMLEVFYSEDRLNKVIEEGCGPRLAQVISLANGVK